MAEPMVWADGVAGTVIGADVWNVRTVLVTDWSGGRLLALTVEHGDLTEWGDGYLEPESVSVLADEALVTERGGTLLLQDLNTPGRANAQVIASGLGSAHQVVRTDDGAALVADYAGGRVVRVDLATGDVSDAVTGLSNPVGVALGADGAVFVTEQGTGALTRHDGGGAVTIVAGLVVTVLPVLGRRRPHPPARDRAGAGESGGHRRRDGRRARRRAARGARHHPAVARREGRRPAGGDRGRAAARVGRVRGARARCQGRNARRSALAGILGRRPDRHRRHRLDPARTHHHHRATRSADRRRTPQHRCRPDPPDRAAARPLDPRPGGRRRLRNRHHDRSRARAPVGGLQSGLPARRAADLDRHRRTAAGPAHPAAVKGVNDAGARSPKDNAGAPTPAWRIVAALVDTSDARWSATVTPTSPAPTIADAQTTWRDVLVGANGVDAFYREMSGNRLSMQLVTGAVQGPVQLDGAWTDWFTMPTGTTQWLVKDDVVKRVVTALQSVTDWTKVDAVFLIFRSPSATNYIWPRANDRAFLVSAKDGAGKDVNVKIAKVGMPHDQATIPGLSFTNVEVSAHELGHTLGLDDLYMDATYTASMQARDLKRHELMSDQSSLPHLSARHKLLLGFLDTGHVRSFDYGFADTATIDLAAVSDGLPTGGAFAAVELKVAPRLSWFFEYRVPRPGRIGDGGVDFTGGKVMGYDATQYELPPIVADKRRPDHPGARRRRRRRRDPHRRRRLRAPRRRGPGPLPVPARSALDDRGLGQGEGHRRCGHRPGPVRSCQQQR